MILLGGGGHCKSIIDAAESAGLKISGILDRQENVGNCVLGYPIIGTDADIPRLAKEHLFIVSLGFVKDSAQRIALYDKVVAAGGKFATVIASTAHVSKHASIGPGTVVLHHATVNAAASVGICAIINTGANIEHDAEVGDFSHISTGAMVNGECRVGKRCFIGSNATLHHCITVCDDVIIGAGSVAYRTIKHPGTYAGNPLCLLP